MASPRFTQFSHGWDRLHLSLRLRQLLLSFHEVEGPTSGSYRARKREARGSFSAQLDIVRLETGRCYLK